MTTITAAQAITCPHCNRDIATTGKDIHYCVEYLQVGRKRQRICHEYVGYYDGREIGAGYATNHDAEIALDKYALNQISEGLDLSATALDGVCQCGATFNEFGQCETCGPDEAPARLPGICEGLQFPCDKPVTHCFHIDLGRDGDRQINSSMELCDDCAAEWQSWNPPAPDTPYCFFHGGAADHETHECPRLEEIADRDEERHRKACGEPSDDHTLVTPDPAECPDVTAPQPVEDLPTAHADPDDQDEDNEDDYQEGDPRDEDVYAPPFGLPAPAGRSACLAYSTPPLHSIAAPLFTTDLLMTEAERGPLFSDRLCNQASDLVTRLIAEKTRLLHSTPPHDLANLEWDERIARLTGCIDRAAARLGRRFIVGMAPVAASLNLWGPPNPLCANCGTHHDPILDCPGRADAALEPGEPCAALRAALTNLLAALADEERLRLLRAQMLCYHDETAVSLIETRFEGEIAAARIALLG